MNTSENSRDLWQLEEEYRQLIDIREGISREIAACRARFGQNTRRREDQVDRLQEEYNRVQQRILEVDKQIRAARSSRTQTAVLGIPMDNTSPIELSRAWLEVKAAEEAAKSHRIDIEEALAAKLGVKTEGAQTHDLGEFKVMLTGVVNRSLNKEVWETIKDRLPPELRPVTYEPKLDVTGVKWLQELCCAEHYVELRAIS